MNELKELKFEELSLEQKLGMATILYVGDAILFPEQIDYLEGLIKSHSLGGLWIIPRSDGKNDLARQRLKEVADYPLLFFTDAEAGLGEHKIGRHNPIGAADNEELAYAFGKVTAATAAKWGYNVICNPVLDMTDRNCVCQGTMRSLGSNKYRVTALAAAEARGVHDGGCLTIAKHFPGRSDNSATIDSHMAETVSLLTKEELLEKNLYPYVELNKMGLLDGVMLGHSRCANIDPDFPTSLSRHVIQIFRDTGFDGIAITDALEMMGIVAKYGERNGLGYAIENAGAMPLAWADDNVDVMKKVRGCYDDGIITDERLEILVRRVLAMQHKVMSLPKNVEPTEKELADVARINTDSVYARTDEGLPTALDRNGKYHFAIMTQINGTTELMVDTFKGNWYHPFKIQRRLQELFPNATFSMISEFPLAADICEFLHKDVEREVVFVTFCIGQAYAGEERFTPRIISLINAMQVSNRISTVVHFGNPYLLEDLPHIPRILVGSISIDGVNAALEVLAGEYPAKGSLTYDVKLS